MNTYFFFFFQVLPGRWAVTQQILDRYPEPMKFSDPLDQKILHPVCHELTKGISE